MTATRLRTARRPRLRAFDQLLTYGTWFCGAGGDTQGAEAVDGVDVVFGANHNKTALATRHPQLPERGALAGRHPRRARAPLARRQAPLGLTHVPRLR
ncbi:hypothetical protein ACU686_26720 [Yinghuangia aomiensis]